MKMHAWLPKQGWFEVVDVLGYFYRDEGYGTFPYAKVILLDGNVCDVATDVQLFYNLQGDRYEEKFRPFTSGTAAGRLDTDGIVWFACDPYPTWYRWEDGELYTTYNHKWADGKNDDLLEGG